MVDPNGENINFTTYTIENTTRSSLTIAKTEKSDTGYFWVGTLSLNACSTSLVVTGMWQYMYICACLTLFLFDVQSLY